RRALRTAPRPVMSAPSKVTVPTVGSCRPHTTLNRVVLPAPFGPIRPVTVPPSTPRSTPCSACTPPNRTSIPSASSSANRRHPLSQERGHRLVSGGTPPEREPVEQLVEDPGDAVRVARQQHGA